MKKESLEYSVHIQAGIQNLPHEILWSIFIINADMFSNTGALTDTRHASQVCQTWREILLERPSLWGKLINLNNLCQETVKDEWRKEVLRRSQGALLWIFTGDSEDEPLWWKFFQSLITKHWSQIQRLVVHVKFVDEDDPTWEAMLQPAPHLEVFQVYLSDVYDGDEMLFSSFWQASKTLSVDLFSNNAPSLRKFITRNISVSPGAPWLSTLRSIFLTSPFTHDQIFLVLQHTPLLEHLTLEDLPYDQGLSLPQLTLSRLSELIVSDFFNGFNRILAHITPAPGCSLTLSTYQVPEWEITVEDLSELTQSLSKYIKNFYKTHTQAVTHISLHCLHDEFYFIDRHHPSGALCDIRLEFGPGSLGFETSTAFAALVSAFTSIPTPFHSVTTLDLWINNEPDVYPSYTSLFSASIFPVTEVVDMREDSLMLFLQNDGRGQGPLGSSSQPFTLPFPSPKVLRLWGITEPTSLKSARASPLILFLNNRRQEGYSVKVLELDLSRPRTNFRNLRHYGPILDQEAVGMTVNILLTGEVREAVCGGGGATQLFL